MSSVIQRAELQSQIWKIVNDVRGSIDGWDFKQYVLGTLFYRFISENFSSYIEAGDDSFRYADLSDDVITEEHIKEILRIFDTKEDIDHVSKSVDNSKIAEEDYNLSVNTYVEAKDTREIIDIKELNAKIKATVSNIDRLRIEIDKIVTEIEVE